MNLISNNYVTAPGLFGQLFSVMTGLVPVIHVTPPRGVSGFCQRVARTERQSRHDLDDRDEPGHDGRGRGALRLLVLLPLALGGAPALAQEVKAGDIVIEKPWARATPKGAPVGAGYLTIHNNADAPDKLTGGTSDFAGVEVHEMSMAGGVMKMREVEGGLEIPAHGTVTLAPSGYHLMFTGLKQPLRKGDVAKATLTFAHAGSIPVEFPVRAIGASGSGSGDSMKGMKM